MLCAFVMCIGYIGIINHDHTTPLTKKLNQIKLKSNTNMDLNYVDAVCCTSGCSGEPCCFDCGEHICEIRGAPSYIYTGKQLVVFCEACHEDTYLGAGARGDKLSRTGARSGRV